MSRRKPNKYILVVKRSQLQKIERLLEEEGSKKGRPILKEIKRSLQNPIAFWKPERYKKTTMINVIKRKVRQVNKLRSRLASLAISNKALIERNRELIAREMSNDI